MIYEVAILINLERRADRLDRVLKHLEKREIKNILVFPAFDMQVLSNIMVTPPKRNYFSWTTMNKGMISCSLSHIASLKMAKSLNYKSVLMIEDDAVLSQYFNDRLDLIEKELPSDWQHLFLGGAIRKQNEMKKISEHIYTSCFTDCSHCYIVRNEGIKIVADEMLKFNTTTDDAINDLISSKRLISYTLLPLASYQYVGFSDVDNKFVARNDTMNNYKELS